MSIFSCLFFTTNKSFLVLWMVSMSPFIPPYLRLGGALGGHLSFPYLCVSSGPFRRPSFLGKLCQIESPESCFPCQCPIHLNIIFSLIDSYKCVFYFNLDCKLLRSSGYLFSFCIFPQSLKQYQMPSRF